jgi:glycosyltransferase involved in cell wall biosynthesis
MTTPTVSVIIPAFNQGRYLGAAIESALAQTYRDFEILVIDDGSTDNTPAVARQYGDCIRYFRQANQGLGGARNTGIRAARGAYLALLDSDDIWLPGFLETMVQLAARAPAAAVLFSRADYIDADGRALPQVSEVKTAPGGWLYELLVRADFIIPSTVVMLRSAVLEAGLFDERTSAIHGAEDWDLWLRLAPAHPFIGFSQSLVHYRLHSSSLSADFAKMQQAVRAVVAKHFGPEDGVPEAWPRMKRLAYGGVYRHSACSEVLRQGDWSTGQRFVRRAMEIDPTLSTDIDFFYDLAMGSQPLGFRGTADHLDLASNATRLIQIVSQVFQPQLTRDQRHIRQQALGTAYMALGLIAYNTGQFSGCRQYLLRALLRRPGLSRNRLVVGDLLKSFVGPAVVGKARAYKGAYRLS